MRFAISTLPFIDSEINEDLFVRLRDYGIMSLEIFSQKPHCDILQEKDRDLIRYAQQSLGFKINSIHLPIYFNRIKNISERRKINICSTDNNIRSLSLKEIARHISTAGEIGVPIVILHTGIEKDDSSEINYLIESLIYLNEIASKSGVLIALENHTTRCVSVELLIELINRVGSDSLGICMDIGHSNIFSNYISDLNDARRFLLSLHLHDNNGEEDEHLLPYEGMIDFDYIIGFLRTSKFEGVVTLELSGDRIVSEEDLDKFLRSASFYIHSFKNPRITYNTMKPT